MPDGRIDLVADELRREAEWARSEKRSFWIATAVALTPIPLALLISWVLGAPPWASKPAPPAGHQAPDMDHGGPFPHR